MWRRLSATNVLTHICKNDWVILIFYVSHKTSCYGGHLELGWNSWTVKNKLINWIHAFPLRKTMLLIYRICSLLQLDHIPSPPTSKVLVNFSFTLPPPLIICANTNIEMQRHTQTVNWQSFCSLFGKRGGLIFYGSPLAESGSEL